jgi:FkbM family methyltransferase
MPNFFDRLCAFAGPDPKIILDVGACSGDTAAAFARRFPNAKVYAFEPHPSLAAICKLTARQYPNMHVIQCAAGLDSGKRKMHLVDLMQPGMNPGSSTLLEPLPSYQTSWLAPVGEVTVVRLEEWAAHLGITRVDVLWIDAQGSDLDVLRGMGHLLKTVRGVQVEVFFEPVYTKGPLAGDIDAFMKSNGFEYMGKEDSYPKWTNYLYRRCAAIPLGM